MIDTSGSLLDRARARVGQTLRAKWRLDKLLGVGGMAAVYAGTHRNGARAAIKILHLALSLDPDVRQRFLREGYIANTVDHPGAVRVLDDDVAEDGCAFLVMELLDGVSLDGHAERRGGKLPYPEVLAIAGKLLEVLSAAHGKGIVHRDIKPDNVFLTREGSLKLLDFGIARLAGATSGKQTAEGSAFGTPAFMAPEQALGRVREIDARTDLWAVGATMFSLLSGREVPHADTVPALRAREPARAPARQRDERHTGGGRARRRLRARVRQDAALAQRERHARRHPRCPGGAPPPHARAGRHPPGAVTVCNSADISCPLGPAGRDRRAERDGGPTHRGRPFRRPPRHHGRCALRRRRDRAVPLRARRIARRERERRRVRISCRERERRAERDRRDHRRRACDECERGAGRHARARAGGFERDRQAERDRAAPRRRASTHPSPTSRQAADQAVRR